MYGWERQCSRRIVSNAFYYLCKDFDSWQGVTSIPRESCQHKFALQQLHILIFQKDEILCIAIGFIWDFMYFTWILSLEMLFEYRKKGDTIRNRQENCELSSGRKCCVVGYVVAAVSFVVVVVVVIIFIVLVLVVFIEIGVGVALKLFKSKFRMNENWINRWGDNFIFYRQQSSIENMCTHSSDGNLPYCRNTAWILQTFVFLPLEKFPLVVYTGYKSNET